MKVQPSWILVLFFGSNFGRKRLCFKRPPFVAAMPNGYGDAGDGSDYEHTWHGPGGKGKDSKGWKLDNN